MPSVDAAGSLRLLRPAVAALNRDVLALTPQQWQHDSNCAGWQIADLVAHVVRNGWSFLAFTQRALTGDPAPSFGPAVAHVQEDIKAAGAQAAAERQARETDELIALAGSLSPADLEKTGGHPFGPRTIAWGCTQRLAEVAFHHWDLRRSLGHDEPLDAAAAAYLLPFMLAPEDSPVMRRPLPEGMPPTTVRLTSGDGAASWQVSITPQGRHLQPDGQDPVDLEVAAEPGWLALALYGRTPVTSSRFRLSGVDAAERFNTLFGP